MAVPSWQGQVCIAHDFEALDIEDDKEEGSENDKEYLEEEDKDSKQVPLNINTTMMPRNLNSIPDPGANASPPS